MYCVLRDSSKHSF